MNFNLLKTMTFNDVGLKANIREIRSSPAYYNEILLKMLIVRSVVLTLIMGMTYWSIVSEDISAAYFCSFFIICTYILSLLNAFALRSSKFLIPITLFQLLSDIALATFAVYLVGTTGSVILYLLVVVGASAVLGIPGAIVTATICGLSFASLSLNPIPPLSNSITHLDRQEILMVYLSLLTFAIAISFGVKKLKGAQRSVRDKESALSELNKRQEQLIDDLPEGVITMNLQDEVIGFNQAARTIIGLSTNQVEQLLGNPLPKILEDWGVSGGADIVREESKKDERQEILILNEDGEKKSLSYSVQFLKSQEGQESGRLFIFDDISHIREMEEKLSLQEEMARIRLSSSPRDIKSPGSQDHVEMIGESVLMKRIFSLVDRVAESDASVLISGESGTGKELIAKAIHLGSSRAEKPFVTVNCGAIPENLIESELFGHVKGAFTGAIRDNKGLFREASEGTIFLDEIGELPLNMQTKLLRSLQERTVRPVGGSGNIPVDVRVVAATNKTLRKEITQGGFREDLFYRLNVINIVLPPLRDRKEDIPHLVNYFIERYNDINEDTIVSPEALRILNSHNFPGNIRELENIIERALVLEQSCILPEHLPAELLQKKKIPDYRNTKLSNENEDLVLTFLPIDLDAELAKIEKKLILSALDQSGGVKKDAATLLGLNFRSFRYRLKKYELSKSGDLVD